MVEVPSTRNENSKIQAYLELLKKEGLSEKDFKILEDQVWKSDWNDEKGLDNHINRQIESYKFKFTSQDVNNLKVDIIDRKKIKDIQKNNNENDILNQLLDEPEVNTQYLDIGESNGLWYYGVNLGGRESIITSNKKCLRNTAEQFKGKTIGSNEIKNLINYDGYISDIATIWSKPSIKIFLTEEVNLDKKELYNEVKSKIDYYMDFDKYENSSTVQACWVLATYVYPLFYWFPHILINAPSNSGKSKNGFILMQLSFRGFDLGASAGVTPAQIFRTIEGNRGTTLIDEFERIDNDAQKLVNQILNASATRDAYVIRTEQIDKKWKAWKFAIFCPKIVCNITGINPTSLSRFIAFNLLKTNTEKGKRKPYRKKDLEAFKPIRDMLHILMLQNWKEIKEIYDNLELNLSNRDEDNWLPICSIAKWIGDKVYNEVMEFIKNNKDFVVETNDITETLFLRIYENITEDNEYYSAKEIANWVVDELGMYKCPDRWVGRKLTEYKFKGAHKAKGNCYLLTKANVKNILDRYFSNCTKETSETSVSSLSSDTSETTQEDVVSEQSEVISEDKEFTKKDIRDLIFTAINKESKPDIPVQNFIEMIGTEYENDVNSIVDDLKKEGIVLENKVGFIKIV